MYLNNMITKQTSRLIFLETSRRNKRNRTERLRFETSMHKRWHSVASCTIQMTLMAQPFSNYWRRLQMKLVIYVPRHPAQKFFRATGRARSEGYLLTR